MVGSGCSFHVAVVPYNVRQVTHGVKAVDFFDPAHLERQQWPRKKVPGKGSSAGGRLAEGGCGGEIVAEQIVLTWHQTRLIFPVSYDAKPLAEKLNRDENEIVYHGTFLAQLDGQVAYVPTTVSGTGEKRSSNSYLMLVESPIAEVTAIRFSSKQAVVVDPFVKHSMPIPLAGTFEFAVWHRSVNAVVQLNPDPAGPSPLIINLNKVDRMKEIEFRMVGQVPDPHAKITPLPSHFSKKSLPLEEVNSDVFSPYGRLVHDFSIHQEQVSEVPWPGSESADGVSGTLEQVFLVEWRLDGEILELEFEGLSGSFTGNKGRPGVEFNLETNVYSASLLMARPDGSFYVHPTEHTGLFAMAFALPNTSNGEPLEETLRVFVFREGGAPRINPGVWHSVPIPLASGERAMTFREVVAATNANLVINVRAETGHPLHFSTY